MAAAATVLFALLCASSASAAGTITVCGSGCDSTTIQGGIGLATDGDTINVGPGTYAEDVTVNKSVTLVGAGSGTSGSIVKGVVGGGSSTFLVGAPGVVIDSFRISRFGNSVADWNDALNSAGVAVQGQTNTVELKNSRLLGNRTAVDINNSNGNSIHDNVIDDNRTGVIFRNQTDGTTFTGNQVTNNWTVGVLFLDASGGTNSPVQSASGSDFSSNNISGNWYGGVVDRQTGGSLPAPGTTNLKSFEENWFGSTAPSYVTTDTTEPGYAAQIPVEFGGTATNPGGAPDLAGPAAANFDYMPYLWTGTDTSADPGFQGDTGNLGVAPTGGTQSAGPARLQQAVSDVDADGTVHAVAGTFAEDVTVAKTETVTGAGFGAGGTTVSGPSGGSGSTLAVAAPDVVIEKLLITRAGNNTTDWNDPNLNSVGVSVQGQGNTVELRDSKLTGNRTGVDLNNSDGNSVLGNVIDDNRTGMILRNKTDDTTVENNSITNNWTVGVLFLDGSGGTNSPVQSAQSSSFSSNDIHGNWYGGIVDRQSGGSVATPGTNEKNFSANWFGTTTPVVTTANSTEPGYAAQIPTEFGGSATNPGGAPDIAGPASANFDYTPLLTSGTDAAPATDGFQGVTADLIVLREGNQSGSTGRVQEGIGDVDTGGSVHVGPGVYAENVTVGKRLTLDGAGSTTEIHPSAAGPALTISASGTQANPLAVSDLKTTGAAGGGNTGTGVVLTGSLSDVTLQRVVSTINSGNGFAVDSTGAFNRLTLDDVTFAGNSNDGARFPASMGKLDGLTITNSNLDNNGFAGMEIYGPPSTAQVTNVDITNSTFSNNDTKGIYAERLDHATLDGVTVNASGVLGPNSAGIDLNLKKQPFLSLTIENSSITNSGTGDTTNGFGLGIKSRDDGSNGPTTVNGVDVNHNVITGNQRGIRLGEPGKNNAGPTGVSITRNNISGSVAEAAVNVSQASADARCNYWGAATGPATTGANSVGTGFSNLASFLVTSNLDGACGVPTAVNDTGTVDQDQVLTAAAPGVLANDTDPLSMPLTAVKVSDPAHGTVALAADGSYVYTPAAGYSGPDSFTYAASNGTAQSNTATVAITVDKVTTTPSGPTQPSGPSGPVGPPSTPGQQNPSDTIAPKFSAVSVTNKTFAVNTRGTAETAVAARARARAKKGTKFKFTLSEAATVTIKFELRVRGRVVGGKCVRQTSKNKKGNRACTLLKRFGAFAVTAKKGANSHTYSGRIGRRSMKPGTYRATIVATDAAKNVSRAKRLNVKVVKR